MPTDVPTPTSPALEVRTVEPTRTVTAPTGDRVALAPEPDMPARGLEVVVPRLRVRFLRMCHLRRKRTQ